MKRNKTIIGLLLIVLLAGAGCHNCKRDRIEMRREMGPGRMGMRERFMEGYPMHRFGMDKGERNTPGMMRGMEPMPMDGNEWMPMGPARRMLESIPNVTENQKKQIEDLIKKQHDEMQKIREEMSAKMKSLMDSHWKEMLNILTDEQKKFIESEAGRPTQAPEKDK